MNIISIRALSKKFKIDESNEGKVLKDLELSIEDASVTAIYGPSGCGKSTLLNIISGLDRDFDGEVYFGTHLLKEMNEVEITNFRKRKIGFVFRNYNLIPYLTVRENIMISLHLNGEKNSINKKKAYQLLKEVHLEKFANKNVTKLSGGQKQRVAIARALANNPEIIIADEPTGSLDTKSSQHILQILMELSQKQKTIIIVTHSNEVAKYADTIIEMRDGRIEKRQLIA